MITNRSLKQLGHMLLALCFTTNAAQAATDISTDPLSTYSATSSTDVKPNVFFVLDDSGSMDWDFMPDWACANSYTTRDSNCGSLGQKPISGTSATPEFWFRNAAYNGIYYNPAIRYNPPVTYTTAGVQVTTYPSMTGTSTTTGGDNTATSGSPNWKAVPEDAYGVQSSSATNLQSTPPYFYTIIAGEYCSSASLRTCSTQSAPTASYSFPANLRWCNSSALSNCRAGFAGSTFGYARAPVPRTATITINGSSSTSISSITVNSGLIQILSGTTTASATSSTVASNIAAAINSCSTSITGACTVLGYTATASGSVVTIFAPGAISDTPVVTKSGTMTAVATAFATGSISGAGTIPGDNLRTTIYPALSSYPYPGTSAKASARTDCVGTTCTYAEEMTNYANWWAYYHSRMQMMKTAASNAFSTLDTATDLANNVSRFRVGYMSIDNNTNSDFLNLGEFATAQKGSWYAKLQAANPGNSTPLRAALSTAGRLYAGKLNGTTLNGSKVTDPLEYSCQQNYTIISTDGFWNESSGYNKMDGSTAVGEQDGGLEAPMWDGGSHQWQQRTSNLQAATITQQRQFSQLQRQDSYLQSTTAQLQKRTSSDSGATWGAGWSNATTCKWDNTNPTLTQCRYLTPVNQGNVSSCTTLAAGTSSASGTTWNGPATTCSYSGWSAAVGVSTCAAVGKDTTSPYTVPMATQCNTVVTSLYAVVPSCSANPIPDANGYTVQCQSTTGTFSNASSCNETASQTCNYTTWSGWGNVSSCTTVPKSLTPSFTVSQAVDCQDVGSGGTPNTLADVAAYYYDTDLRNPDTTQGTGTCTGPIIPPATTTNDLCADNVQGNGHRDGAAWQHMTTYTLGLGSQGDMVYQSDYLDANTDFNKALTSGDFYDVWKKTSASTTAASNGICTWQTSGQCVWPIPASNSQTNIDDLWHAAINGRGAYYSASDPASLSAGLAKSLQTIVNTPRPGTAAAAASSNPNISTSDNYVFSSSYKTVDWYGELVRQQLDPVAKTLSSIQWSALTLLDCATTNWAASTSYAIGNVYQNGGNCYKVAVAYTSGTSFGSTDTSNTNRVVDMNGVNVVPLTSRTIYTKDSSGLIPFNWTSLSTTQQAYFEEPTIAYVSTIPFVGLTQFCTVGVCLTSAQQTNNTIATGGAAGEALVNFLRGDRSNEGTYFRSRTHILGDIVSSEGRYVKQPLFNYVDTNFGAYVAAMATRTSEVYVAANDGMLHAFDATSGQETWAYVPATVLPSLYKLADSNYSTKHQFFVDGTPEVGDICPNAPSTTCTASQWKTILVGGLNRGGQGYYALDITNPAAPSLLWEISSTTTGFTNLGYTYGNPVITKLQDGTWVVIFASGYNNADGIGHLYVVNANTGSLIRTISTNTGSTVSPSGLSRIVGYAPQSVTDNTTVAVYGGDLLGNLWRFDINNSIGAAGFDAQLLISFVDSSGNAQPITEAPTVTTVGGNPVVYVGTGRYLGVTDISNTRTQSFYAVKDSFGSTTYGNPRTTSNNFIQQTLYSGTCPSGTSSSVCNSGDIVRTVTSNNVDWTVDNGWYLDFLTGGERSATDPSLGLGTLVFTTFTPQSSTANVCGAATADASASFSYQLDYLTGGAVVGTNGVAAVSLGSSIATRPVLIRLPDGSVIELIRTSGGSSSSANGSGSTTTGGEDAGGATKVEQTAIKPPTGSGTHRTTWRQLQ